MMITAGAIPTTACIYIRKARVRARGQWEEPDGFCKKTGRKSTPRKDSHVNVVATELNRP